MGCNELDFQSNTSTQVDKDFDFSASQAYTASAGDAIDVTNDTFVLIIKDALDGSALLTLNEVGDNLTTGLYIPSPTSGIINIQITDTDVGTIAAGSYPYEMNRTDSDSKLFIFMQGTVQFSDRGF